MDLLVISISILIAGGRTCPGPLQEAEAAEKNHWHLEVFFRVQSPKWILLKKHIVKVFIGILGESFEIQFLAIFYIDFNKRLRQNLKSSFKFFIIKAFIGILGAP
jgi:hypothetical protein